MDLSSFHIRGLEEELPNIRSVPEQLPLLMEELSRDGFE
jgi:hypothetical protein